MARMCTYRHIVRLLRIPSEKDKGLDCRVSTLFSLPLVSPLWRFLLFVRLFREDLHTNLGVVGILIILQLIHVAADASTRRHRVCLVAPILTDLFARDDGVIVEKDLLKIL